MPGFWGTHREEAWRRRKDREHAQQDAIRREGAQTLAHVNAVHAEELEKKEGVLDIARGLLRDARYDSSQAKKKRAPVTGVASLKDDSEDQTADDAKPSARKRVKVDESCDSARDTTGPPEKVTSAELNGKVAGIATVATDVPILSDGLPDKVISATADAAIVTTLPDDSVASSSGVVGPPDSIMSSGEGNQNDSTPDPTTPSSLNVYNEEEKAAEESVRENLLALSYAMFDTLYGARSFQPRSFVKFLVNKGEKGLAEEIALAAIEKSGGSREHVKFVLDELVPNSNNPNQLVESVTNVLGATETTPGGGEGPSVGGKDYLAKWHAKNGNTDQAFAAALLMKTEVDILTHALPLTTTAARRQELRAACPHYLRSDVIGVFKDDEWPAFMSSLLPLPRDRLWGGFRPAPESYLKFASNKMKAPDNARVAAFYVEKVIAHESRAINNSRSASIPGSYNADQIVKELVSVKTKVRDVTYHAIDVLDSAFYETSVRAALQKIGFDPIPVVIQTIGKNIVLPPKTECLTKHKNKSIAFKCSKCKKAHLELAINLGLAQALREYPTLMAFHAALIAPVYGLQYAPINAEAKLEENHFDREAVSALLGNNPKIYCTETEEEAMRFRPY